MDVCLNSSCRGVIALFLNKLNFNSLIAIMRDFSLTNLMLVTGTSFLVFTAGMKFLDGTINHFLLNTGLISLGLD